MAGAAVVVHAGAVPSAVIVVHARRLRAVLVAPPLADTGAGVLATIWCARAAVLARVAVAACSMVTVGTAVALSAAAGVLATISSTGGAVP